MAYETARSELLADASSRGRSERWVRWAVDAGLIPKGRPKGNGRGKGQAWFHPSEARRCLRALHRLRAMGVRQPALSFCLWWIGVGDFNPACRAYILKMQTGPSDRLGRKVTKQMEVEALDGQERLAGAMDEQSLRAEALATQLGMMTSDPKKLESAIEPLRKLLPALRLKREEIEPLVAAFAASSLGVEATLVDGSVGYLAETAGQLSGGLSPEEERIFDSFLAIFQTPAMFRILVGSIQLSTAKESGEMRLTVRGNPYLMRWLRGLVASEKESQARMSRRKLLRQGPWVRPAPAYRAALVGLLIGSKGISEQLDYGEAFSKLMSR